MKPRFYVALVLAAALPVAVAAKAGAPIVVQPDSTKWMAVSSGPMAGAEMAVLVGDPSKAGPYTIRIKAKDGTKFGPHYHKEVENVTVISGDFLVGIGDKMDEAKMTELPPGTFVSVPAKLHHYAMAKGETVLQIQATGPRTMVMLK